MFGTLIALREHQCHRLLRCELKSFIIGNISIIGIQFGAHNVHSPFDVCASIFRIPLHQECVQFVVARARVTLDRWLLFYSGTENRCISHLLAAIAVEVIWIWHDSAIDAAHFINHIFRDRCVYATTAEVVASGSKCPFVTAFVFGFHLFKCPKDTRNWAVRNVRMPNTGKCNTNCRIIVFVHREVDQTTGQSTNNSYTSC